MARPSKEEVISRLRSFAHDVLDAAKIARGRSLVTERIEAIEAIAWQATLVTERLNATGRDYVAPDTAQALTELARLTDTVAESIADGAMQSAVRAPGHALNAFVSKFSPEQTISGKFIFRLDDEDSPSLEG